MTDKHEECYEANRAARIERSKKARQRLKRAWKASPSETETSLETIGELLGVTKERVRQIEASALKRMRAGLEAAGIDATEAESFLSDAAKRTSMWANSLRDKSSSWEPDDIHRQRIGTIHGGRSRWVARPLREAKLVRLAPFEPTWTEATLDEFLNSKSLCEGGQ